MKLSNAEAAIISPQKVRDYLLSPGHPVGRYKAASFRALGYEQKGWEAFAGDIRVLLASDASLVERTEFGEKYTVTGDIVAPNGAEIRSYDRLDYSEW